MAEIATKDAIQAAYEQVEPLPDEVIDGLVRARDPLFREAEANAHLGWRAAGGEAQKNIMSLSHSQLRWFAGHVYGGIGFEYLHDFLMSEGETPLIGSRAKFDRTKLAAEKAKLIPTLEIRQKTAARLAPSFVAQWAALIQEPAEIGGLKMQVQTTSLPKPVNPHGLRVGLRAPMLMQRLDRHPKRLMEIGGGHGRFIRDCALMMPGIKLILTDLPFNMLISARYLMEYFGDDLNLCFLPEHRFDADARINIVAPWRLGEIDVPVDTACNFLSFHHMDEANLAYYGDAMLRMGVDRLFQVNRDTTRDPHDFALKDYPFMSQFEDVTNEILAKSKTYQGGTGDTLALTHQIMSLSRRI